MAARAIPDPDQPVISGYAIEHEIGGSLEHRLYRCQRRSDGVSFLLKTPRHAGRDAALRLQREYDISHELGITGLVQAQELIQAGEQPALLLQDPGGQPLSRLLEHGPLEVVGTLECGRQLADTLATLHHRGFIHRDLQPCHVLVDLAANCVALSGLGRATSVPREAPGLRALDRHRQDLAYIAPEQTGRINYLVDYRTDLYALGVLLFTMLTGRLPFVVDDPLDLIYAHIAQPPPAPSDIAPHVPEVVSAVVLKLLAKAPEARYQSGSGVAADLRRCLREYREKGAIRPFEPGQHDVPARLELPQRLYGRAAALRRLTQAFEHVTRAHPQVLLVSGYAGIGKTALLREFCQQVHLRGGYVISGKYHEHTHHTPYSGLQAAVGDLVEQLLGDAPERLSALRAQLTDTLGANLGVLVAVFPALGAIIRDVAPVAVLRPAEARNRLHLCMQRFLGAITSEEHPLVLCLDDLQWSDRASLDLIASLLTLASGAFLLVGAYRDHEVDAHHPLRHTVEALQAHGVSVATLPLDPLGPDELQGLIVDTLRTDAARAALLADLLYKKTAGNPFFARSFLLSAYQEGLMWLQPGSGWEWDLAQISAMAATDNVIELIMQRLQRLPERVRQTVRCAAALGDAFEAALLALVADRPLAEIEADLLVACQDSIVLKQGESYHFVHDRVRASAYGLIPEAARAAIHLRISRILKGHASEGEADNRIFALVHHVNRAAPLLEAVEWEEAARLNRRAGQRAEATGAFGAAFAYFCTGLTMLGKEAWSEHYALTLTLHSEAAEAARLMADFAAADRLARIVHQQARTMLDAIPAYETQVSVALTRLGEVEGFRLAFEVLELLGVEMLPAPEKEEDARALFLEAHHTLDTILARADRLSPMTEPTKLAAMRILTRMALAASLNNILLYEMAVCKMVELTAAYGYSPASALAYVLTGGLRCRLLGDSESGYQAGIAGLTLIERLGATAVKSLAHMIFNSSIQPWRVHASDLLAPLAEARRLGLETGDFLSATTSALSQCFLGFCCGQDLFEIKRLARDYRREATALGQQGATVMLASFETLLEELTAQAPVLSAPGQEQGRDGAGWPPAGLSRHSTVYYAVTSVELWSHVVFRRHDRALTAAPDATTERLGTAPAIIPWEFLCALALLGGERQRSLPEREQLLTVVDRLLRQLERRAGAAPHTYGHKAALVAAERARVVGNTHEAMVQYQQAIDAAHESGYLLEAALANEMAAEFYLACGYYHLAAMSLQAAATVYGRWGARAKVVQLREHYPQFLASGQPMASSLQSLWPNGGGTSASGALDLASIERAAGALSQQLDLAELLHQLLSILLHHTGAQRGVLLRAADGSLFVEASAAVDQAESQVLLNRPLETCADLPQTVVRYVSRAAPGLVVGDPAQDDRFARDGYIVHAHPRSMLCVPVQHHGVLEAIIYLEHRQLSNVFGEERIAAVQLIAAQAAVALENARLHADLKHEVAQRQRVEEALRQALHETATLKDRLQAENLYLQEEIKGGHDFNEMIGESETWRRVLFKVEQVAATDASVLILGETGTGKELIARALHSRSRRQAHSLVKVNCAALPATLIESELFGHEKGAFTGALTRKKGRFELADGGTLFLDEIGDLPLELQAKLLRVLQEGEFERLGSTQTLTVDVRIIAATNRDLTRAVQAGSFRADLYYRLNVFPLDLPPLRARREDIPLLVWYFITKHQRKLGKQIEHVPDQVMQGLTTYAWPGNARELENVIERALILSPHAVLWVEEPFVAAAPSWTPPMDSQRLEDLERQHIGQVLAACGGRIKGKGGAAERLGMKPSTLYTRMKKLDIARPPRDVSRLKATAESPTTGRRPSPRSNRHQTTC